MRYGKDNPKGNRIKWENVPDGSVQEAEDSAVFNNDGPDEADPENLLWEYEERMAESGDTETDGFRRYLKELGSIRMLVPEEEIALAQKIREGNRDALNRLVTANLRLVISVAKHYQGYGISLEDLI